ncbi:MAG: hypothetical protein JSW11_17645 [Candidatus Heimdallarchaeota archaeon]|nr:MAG: hypothetical protein JSW11_17645 [Candidatus Heimdallarchaeota archaeon]
MDLLPDLEPTLEILDKIVAFEEKMEINRMLLFIALAGFITIIGGWIEYVCYHFLSIDSTFFILGLASNSDLVLLLGLWLIYLLPLLGVIIFTTGLSPGFINWNKAYRKVGLIIIGLFVLTHLLVIIFGSTNPQLIPTIWGITVSLGFLLTSRILYLETKNKQLQSGLFIFGISALVLGFFSSLVIYPGSPELAMFLYCTIFGLILIGVSMTAYWNVSRLTAKQKEA